MHRPSRTAATEPAVDLTVDRGFLARLLLGALAEHEQRRLALRLLHLDDSLRRRVAAALRPLFADPAADPEADPDAAPDAGGQRFDGAIEEIVELCERAAGRDDSSALTAARSRLLDEAGRDELDEIVRGYTYDEALRLGRGARRMFSWPMAEHLLERARADGIGDREARTALYLATAVVDVLDLLGTVDLVETRPRYAAALRREIDAAHPAP